MQYKTIVLALIEQRSSLDEKLRTSRTLLATVERSALALKTCYEVWKAELAERRLQSRPEQIASEALELAIQEYRESLPPESEANGDAHQTRNDAPALHHHSPTE